MKFFKSNRRSSNRASSQRRRSFKPCFEALEDRRVLSGLPFDDSGLAPAGLQALCALPNLPVFNVHDYGATGNGVSDDTLAIRAAISAAKTSGGGIIYLPTGTYAVDPQASDPKAWGPIFSIISSNIVFIGDGASNTHLVGYVEGLKDPATNWYVTGDPYQKIGRGNMFEVDPSANVTGIQFRSLDINGQAGYTGNFTVGGNIVTGDGWDTYDKAICLGFGTHRVDNTLIFNCNIRNWRGEEIYAGGSINGAISVVNCTLTGTNADAISCSAAVLLSHSTIGGTSAGDDVYNGLEDYCFPTQSTTVDHSTIICSSNPAAPRGYGLSFEGEVGGSALTVTNSVFANNSADILLQDTAHNVLIDSNTFTNSLIGGVITSILNLYPGVTSGFSDATISNNTFSGNWQAASLCALGNYGPNPTRNFPNLVISGNTVTKGQLLGGAFGGTLGSWTGFVVENNTLKPGTRDIDPGSQGSNIGLWSGTIRPTFGTSAFYASGVTNIGGSGPTATIKILSDMTVLAANSAGSNPIAAEIDPAILSGFPVGFTTTVYASWETNWVLPANSAWNTWVSDIPVTVGGAGVTIRVNGQGLFELVNQVTTSTTVSSSDSSSIFGQSVTFTAAVSASTPGAGTPTGTVTFVDGSITLGTATLDPTGKATFTTSALSVGNHVVTASYSGPTNFATSSGNLTQTVNQASAIATVTSSDSSSTFGQSVIFTAIVSANAPSSGTPTGMVTFADGSTTLGSGTLDSTGKATFTTSALGVGAHTITVSYAGDTNFAANSGNVTQTVNQATTIATVTSSASTSVFGQSVTFTATVNSNQPGSGIPTGTLTFADGSTTLGVGTLDSMGKATFTTSALGVGAHTITVSYAGDTNFAANGGNVTQTVNQATTIATVTSSASTSFFGQSVTFTATVRANQPGSGIPTGTLTFADGSTTLGVGTLDSTGKAAFTTSVLGVGAHTITVSYAGDTNFATSAGNTVQIVNQATAGANTSTTVTSSADLSVRGQTVTFTATVRAVAAGSGALTGTVTFVDGATVIGTGTVNSTGKATFSTSALGVGGHVIHAFYGGDASFAASAGNVTQTVKRAITSTTATSSVSSSVFGQLVIISVTVRATAPGSGTPTGTVIFRDGNNILGTSVLDSTGKATFSTSALGVGSHAITVSYGGDANFIASAGTMTQTVKQATTTATVTSSANSSVYGQSVTFTATLSAVGSGSATPKGKVVFLDGNNILGTSTLDSAGKATFSTAALNAGSHVITVSYAGGTNFARIVGKLTQIVTSAMTSTILTSSASSSVFGQSVTFTVIVSAISPGSGIPTGKVIFRDGSTILGTGLLDKTGKVTFSTSVLRRGSHTIAVSYAGIPNFASSIGSITQAIS